MVNDLRSCLLSLKQSGDYTHEVLIRAMSRFDADCDAAEPCPAWLDQWLEFLRAASRCNRDAQEKMLKVLQRLTGVKYGDPQELLSPAKQAVPTRPTTVGPGAVAELAKLLREARTVIVAAYLIGTRADSQPVLARPTAGVPEADDLSSAIAESAVLAKGIESAKTHPESFAAGVVSAASPDDDKTNVTEENA